LLQAAVLAAEEQPQQVAAVVLEVCRLVLLKPFSILLTQ
jgi:hypothetical protein